MWVGRMNAGHMNNTVYSTQINFANCNMDMDASY